MGAGCYELAHAVPACRYHYDDADADRLAGTNPHTPGYLTAISHERTPSSNLPIFAPLDQFGTMGTNGLIQTTLYSGFRTHGRLDRVLHPRYVTGYPARQWLSHRRNRDLDPRG